MHKIDRQFKTVDKKGEEVFVPAGFLSKDENGFKEITEALHVGKTHLWFTFLSIWQSTQPRKPPAKKATFALSLNEKANIIYDFYFKTGSHGKYEFLISLNNIEVSRRKVELFITETYPKYPTPPIGENITLGLGEQFTWSITEEGGMHLRLIKLENTKAMFETWFEVGPPHKVRPLAPKEIIIIPT